MKTIKTSNCYVNNKYYCDALQFALDRNIMLPDAKRLLKRMFPNDTVMFKVESKKSS